LIVAVLLPPTNAASAEGDAELIYAIVTPSPCLLAKLVYSFENAVPMSVTDVGNNFIPTIVAIVPNSNIATVVVSANACAGTVSVITIIMHITRIIAVMRKCSRFL